MYSNMEIDRNKQEEGEERKEELPIEIVLVLKEEVHLVHMNVECTRLLQNIT